MVADDEVEFRGENSGKIPGFVLDGTFKISGPLTTLQDKWGYVEEVPERLLNATFKNQPITDATGLKWAAMNLAQGALRELFNGSSIINVPDIIFHTIGTESLRSFMVNSQSDPGKFNIRIHNMRYSNGLNYMCKGSLITEMGTITIGRCSDGTSDGNALANLFESTPITKYGNIKIGYNIGYALMKYMFVNCASLVNPGDITIYCVDNASTMFQEMFRSCTSLVQTPNINIVSMSKNASHNSMFKDMFSRCTSLTTINTITTFAQKGTFDNSDSKFESMFARCTALTSIPNSLLQGLKHVAHYGLQRFVNECTNFQSLTIPDIDVENNTCLQYIASLDSSLNEIRIYVKNPSIFNGNAGMFNGVAQTGTLHQLTGLPWTAQDWQDNAGLPSGWTVVSDL